MWGLSPQYIITLPGGYLVNGPAGLRPVECCLTLFAEQKSRATRLATKSKTDFKVHSPVVQYTPFRFVDMSGYLRKTQNQPEFIQIQSDFHEPRGQMKCEYFPEENTVARSQRLLKSEQINFTAVSIFPNQSIIRVIYIPAVKFLFLK